MSGLIQMTPAELTRQAKTYGKSAQDLHTMLNQLNTMQGEMSQMWKGRAFESYNEQYDQLSKEVLKFADLLDQIQLQLEKTAEAVAQQDQALAQNFGLR